MKQLARTSFILYYVIDVLGAVENKQEVHAIVADFGEYRCMLRNNPPQGSNSNSELLRQRRACMDWNLLERPPERASSD